MAARLPNWRGGKRDGPLHQMKKCPRCKLKKSLKDFFRCRGRKDGHTGFCKICHYGVCKIWQKKNGAKKKEYHNRHFYNLEPADFKKLLVEQKRRCLICKRPLKNKGKWGVDHCHKTGKVRGILCFMCNSGLGHFQDSVERVQAALNYLRKHQ